MDTLSYLKQLIEEHDLNKSELARELGIPKEKFHYWLTYGKTCDLERYSKLRRALENRGIRVDDLDTMSVTGLAAYVNNEASKLVMECIQSLSDGCLSDEEKAILRKTFGTMKEDLSKLEAKL